MISISKEEVKLIRKRFPWAHIRRTTHRYYVEEHKRVLEFLKSHAEGKE